MYNYYLNEERQIPSYNYSQTTTAPARHRGNAFLKIVIALFFIAFLSISVLSIFEYKQVRDDLTEARATVAEMQKTVETLTAEATTTATATAEEVKAELEKIDEKLTNDADYQKILSDLIKYLERGIN